MEHAQSFVWTSERVARFWDYWSQHDDRLTYFSQQVGRGVTKFLDRYVDIAGAHILDVGAGPGFLVDCLLSQGAHVAATDSSPESVAVLEQRFANIPAWHGARVYGGDEVSWPPGSFDVVTCVETIEHLAGNQCDQILLEILRVLKPGGTAIFTTPNNERLQDNFVFCPCCATEFHRWQHVRSWTPGLLQAKLSALGYAITDCRGVNFRSIQRGRLCQLGEQGLFTLLSALHRFGWSQVPGHAYLNSRLLHHRDQHLVAVARKL
jgi:2-polyprenyl-3-methyl-5-hydroxy-6-metoxy-1,4-benzoquinol methylase